ncbi:MAG TPA: hypothetical protein VED63_11675, partial [Acidimicrobiales bacterium]|nr:hypothetical protein [Acidimicrobiales bacterium]
VTSQLEAQAGSVGLGPQARQAAMAALDDPAVRHAVAVGDPGPTVEAALEKADPALAPLLKGSSLSAPGLSRFVIREGARIRPLAELGLIAVVTLCALALLVAVDRFHVLRRVGWWGIWAAGTTLLVGWVLPDALGLSRSQGDGGALVRAGLAATVPLRALSETLGVAGAVLVVVGLVVPPLVHRQALASTDATGQRAPSAMPGPQRLSSRRRRRGGYGAISSSSKVDVRL